MIIRQCMNCEKQKHMRTIVNIEKTMTHGTALKLSRHIKLRTVEQGKNREQSRTRAMF